MTLFRPVELSELDAFSSIGDADTARLYRNYLVSSLEAGETSPDRWFGAFEGDELVGRIVYWSLPANADLSLDVFALPWADATSAEWALDFLNTSLTTLRGNDVRAVEYEHHEPDPDLHTPPRLLDTLAAAGFRQVRRTIRFERSPVVASPDSGRVSYRGEADGASLDEFVDVLARCTVTGADTGVTRRRGGDDIASAAREFVESASAMRGGTALWRIARTGDDAVGVIFPTANDGGPVLNYLGVVPEHRGKGLVDELLAQTVRLHAAAGADRIRADSDFGNTHMHTAFARAGWREFGRCATYRLELRT